MKPIWIAFIVTSVALLGAVITLQVMSLQGEEAARKARDAAHLWIGGAGIFGLLLLLFTSSFIIAALPEINSYLKKLSESAIEAVVEVKGASASVKSLATDIKGGSNVVDTVKGAVQAVTQALVR